MNPCRPLYTPSQEARLKAGRQALLERWKSPPFSDGQPRGYSVTLGDEVMDGSRGMCDRFVVRCAAPVMTHVWEQELQRLGTKPEYTKGVGAAFHVYVSHERHLRRGWLPMSVDAACMGEAVGLVCMIACLIGLAQFIAST